MASPAVQAAAAKIGRGRATIALELVGFDADLGAAMKYAFGNAFVCKVRSLFPAFSVQFVSTLSTQALDSPPHLAVHCTTEG